MPQYLYAGLPDHECPQLPGEARFPVPGETYDVPFELDDANWLPTTPKPLTLTELRAKATDLGVDITGLKKKAQIEAAIAEAKPDDSLIYRFLGVDAGAGAEFDKARESEAGDPDSEVDPVPPSDESPAQPDNETKES